MKKLVTLVAVGALAGPAAAAQAQTPTSTDRSNAAKHCKDLRAKAGGAENFRSAVDVLVEGKVTTANAYGKCVSFHAKDEAKERSSAQKQAVAGCKAERDQAQTDLQKAAFAEKYQARNVNAAYGKCVSKAAKAKKAEADEQDQARVNAARACRTEQGTTDASRAAFAKEHRNFGACVSEKARAQNDA